MNQKKLILIVSFFLALAVIFGITIFKKERLNNYQGKDDAKSSAINKKIDNKNNKEVALAKCKDGWESYNNDVLGIGFCYLDSWGKPTIEPLENLTLLDGALIEYSGDEHNAYNNSLFIKFKENEKEPDEKGNNLELRIFNENYKGEYYPNSEAYEKGYIDNVADLKANKNICDYQVEFTQLWKQQGRMTEFWSQCNKGIKDRIIINEEYFDKNIYSYNLESLAYLKLQNNFFDNVLIKKNYLAVSQVEKNISNFSQIFETKNYPSTVDNSKIISQEKYAQQRDDFGNFVSSIYSYKPIIPEKKDFQITNGEDNKITLIRKYYWLIENQNLEEAYKMNNRINISLDDFKALYQKTRFVQARDFQKVNDNTYKFFLDYQDHNNSKKIYRLTLRIINEDKLEIITTEEIVSEMVKSGDFTAYSKKQNGKSFLILGRYGIETVIDQGEADYREDYSNLENVKFFRDIKFSDNGNYLIYTMSGWEWSIIYIYDINNDKEALSFDSGTYGFSADEKSFFVCTNAGMVTNPGGIIYNTPDFKKQFELFGSDKNLATEVRCNYDKDKNELTFIYDKDCSDFDDKNCKKNEVVYSFNENKMISSKISSN
ncbi:MAG: hypothetical protein WC682_00725 [Parcubacteria group bacterium]|jgi:hypothetical protein